MSLRAERLGNRVEILWKTPGNTTNGDANRGVVTAVVCRKAGNGTCNVVKRQPVLAGNAVAEDELSGTLAQGPPVLLQYFVSLENTAGRTAGASGPVYAVGGEALAAVDGLLLKARREGVEIHWQPVPMSGLVELTRTLQGANAGTTGQNVVLAGVKSGSRSALVTLRPAGATEGKDSGGMLDEDVRDGETYLYKAQRVQRMTLNGRALELRGVASSVAAFTYRNEFAPRAPVGLVSAAGGGFGAAMTIDLSWSASADVGLAGYNVYRREDAGAFLRANAALVEIPGYRDLSVRAGHRYTYRVTAVDVRQHESAPSDVVTEELK